MTGDDVLPVSFSELTEVEVVDLAELHVALFVPDHAFDKVLLREVHGLELVQERDVSEVAVNGAGEEVTGTVHDWIVLSTIESDLGWLICVS